MHPSIRITFQDLSRPVTLLAHGADIVPSTGDRRIVEKGLDATEIPGRVAAAVGIYC
jgi:hypothetical protein